MYIFNDIELLLTINSLQVLKNTEEDIYVTEMLLESDCFDYTQRSIIKKMQEDGILKLFSLGDDFYKFSMRESHKYPGLHVIDFASIYFCMINNSFIVSSNTLVIECAASNDISILPKNEILINIIKDKKYVEFIQQI